MFKFLKDRKKDNKGFTLVELIIVIAILAILVGLLAPQYVKYVEKSRKSADVSDLDNLVEGLKVAAADTEYNLSTTNGNIVYTIVMSNKGTELIKGTGTDIAAADDPAAKALEEYSGVKFTDAKLITEMTVKSQKWGKNGSAKITDATSEIWATITITAADSVTVEYSANVDEYSKTGTVTAS